MVISSHKATHAGSIPGKAVACWFAKGSGDWLVWRTLLDGSCHSICSKRFVLPAERGCDWARAIHKRQPGSLSQISLLPVVTITLNAAHWRCREGAEEALAGAHGVRGP